MISSESSGPEPDKSKLELVIEKSGKPLEMIVSSYLDENQWKSVYNTDTFYDKDEDKLRDVDIVASDGPFNVQNLELETYLIIECKKDTKYAWVFFTRPFDFAIEDISGHYLDEAQMAAKNTENHEILSTILKDAQLHYKNIGKVAVTSELVPLYPPKDYDPQKQEKPIDLIYKAENQLKKYIDWAIDQDIRKRTQLLPYSIEMYFPCLLLQGYMYEATLENGKVKLEKRNHIVLETLFRSEYSVYEQNLLIDVVNVDFFNEYQKLIRDDILSLKEAIKKNSELISSRITEILSLLESAKRNR
jgi:hypothetical protein